MQDDMPDLLLLDVEMLELTGIQLTKTLTNSPFIMFIFSHPHYAVDAFKVDEVDYLVKPVSTEKMMRQ
ncbi:MAG: response regulator [Ferruginibacter sp.]